MEAPKWTMDSMYWVLSLSSCRIHSTRVCISMPKLPIELLNIPDNCSWRITCWKLFLAANHSTYWLYQKIFHLLVQFGYSIFLFNIFIAFVRRTNNLLKYIKKNCFRWNVIIKHIFNPPFKNSNDIQCLIICFFGFYGLNF